MLVMFRGWVIRAIKWLLQIPADALISSSAVLDRKLDPLNNPILSAKFAPYQPRASSFIILKSKSNGILSSDFPVPPKRLWWGYAETAEKWLASGREHFKNMTSIVNASDFCLEGKRILELGCGAGRMIRCLGNIARNSEIRGVDVSAEHILWCKQHLTPPFHFTSVTTLPHLPFEDGYFDFIYAGSVFTHISDLADTWLLELKRVIRPGGRLYITVHDNHTIEILETKKKTNSYLAEVMMDFDKKTKFRTSDWGMVSFDGRSPHTAQVFYDRDYFCDRCQEEYEVVSITPEAYDYQTAFLLAKAGS